jgi:CYTH domain-containing protein
MGNAQDSSAFDDEMKDFEYERRFFCEEFPAELDDGDAPALIIQSYYVHKDNYALRIRIQANHLKVDMDAHTDPIRVLGTYRDEFTRGFVTVKGPSIGGTRYEAERSIDPGIAAELIMRGGELIIKNRYSAWIGQDGWSIDIFGADNYPLIVAEAERAQPVTDLEIPPFCITEITDEVRFSNDSLAQNPFKNWSDDYARELARGGPKFHSGFGTNKHLQHNE